MKKESLQHFPPLNDRKHYLKLLRTTKKYTGRNKCSICNRTDVILSKDGSCSKKDGKTHLARWRGERKKISRKNDLQESAAIREGNKVGTV